MQSKKIFLEDKIFIAGSRGMAGSAIYRKFKNYGYGDQKKGGCILRPSKSELNLLNFNEVEDWFQKNKPNVVVLAAAKVGGIFANSKYPATFLMENIKIQTNLIENAWKSGVRRLLFLGSSCIYPKYATQPIKEEFLLESALEPTNEWYAIAKISGLKLCQSLRKQYGFDAISLMPTNLYGPGDNYHPQNSHVVAALIRKFCEATKNHYSNVVCWGTGSARREFMHVDDLGAACLFALEYWDPSLKDSPKSDSGEVLNWLNVGIGEDITIKELAIKIAEISKFEGDLIWDSSKPDGTPQKLLNIEKIKKLGWNPTIKIDDGLKKVINEYKKITNF
tara:strand:+ start:5805 stop:6809 length:1005 start_codon:yes stop_codon:yes gene_type:complete